MTSTNSKRRRTADDKGMMSINNLPDALLTGIAKYLADPSRALFAIALTPTFTQPTETSNAIVSGGNWQTLDFGDIEKQLASKLTDDDVHKMLICIDGINNIKTLKLAGCVNITGRGLHPLNTAALEQIDLSLVGKHESPDIEPEPLLCESVMIPFLDSILSKGRLKHLDLPTKFRLQRSREMRQFLERYISYLESFRYGCSKCERLCQDTGLGALGAWVRLLDHYDFFGTQSYTCCQCLDHFCDYWSCLDGELILNSEDGGKPFLRFCSKCEKRYCMECVSGSECCNCEGYFCDKCQVMKLCEGVSCESQMCEECTDRSTCSYCDQTRCRYCKDMYHCTLDGCGKSICEDCVDSKGGGKCDMCSKVFCCSDCQYVHCNKDWVEACTDCTHAVASNYRRKCNETKSFVRGWKICKEVHGYW